MTHNPPDPATVTIFFAAINRGDLSAVTALLRATPALAHATDPKCFGATPLTPAAGNANLPLIDLLINAGADPNKANDWWAGGFTPLDSADNATADHLISRGAILTPHAAARLNRIDDLRRLLDASPELVHARGGDGQFPLHFAATPQIAALLLERGAAIDATDIDHASTAAQYAASDRPAVARFLLSHGAAADLFMACMVDDIALATQLAASEPDGVRTLITPARFPAPGSQALGIYHYTVGTNCTTMHAAAVGDAPDICRWLAAQGVPLDARGGYDSATPLHQAAWGNRARSAEALLDLGAPIDARSGPCHNNTPLGWAIVAGSVEVVRLLLARGATIHDWIPTDAAAGARGEFQAFKRHVPLNHWVAINNLFNQHS